MTGRKNLLTLTFMLMVVSAAIVLFLFGMIARRNEVLDEFSRAVAQSTEIQIDWIHTTRQIEDPDDLSKIKSQLASPRLHPEWNYKKRVLHGTIILLRDGHELALVDYWGDGLIGIRGELFRLESDPFPQFRGTIHQGK